MVKICTICHRVFHVRGKNRSKSAKFCSRICQKTTYLKEKECIKCRMIFKPRTIKQKYCSRKCYWTSLKGTVSPRRKEKLRKVCQFCGKEFYVKHYLDRIKCCSISCSKKYWWLKNKEKHPCWKGGIEKENNRIRKSSEYKEWRMNVFQRDRFTCIKCGYRSKISWSHKDGKCDIRADHIKPFSLYPDLRLNLDNGRTLCVRCDRLIGWNHNRGKKYWGKNSIKNVK